MITHSPMRIIPVRPWKATNVGKSRLRHSLVWQIIIVRRHVYTRHIRRHAKEKIDMTLDGIHQVQIPGGVQSQRISQPGGTATSRAGFGSLIGSRTTSATLSPSAGKKMSQLCGTRA